MSNDRLDRRSLLRQEGSDLSDTPSSIASLLRTKPKPLPPFPCPPTATGKKVAPNTIATWDAPEDGIVFPVLQGLFRDPSSGRAEIPPDTYVEMDNITFPVCARCNAIMDSDSAQRSLLYTDSGEIIPDDCIQLRCTGRGARERPHNSREACGRCPCRPGCAP